jgi:predicted RNA-binding protein with TRAM domain
VVNNQPSDPTTQVEGISVPDGPNQSSSAANTEMPPLPRNLSQPPNTNFFQTTKQSLKGDLLLNFVGFSMYYPKDWALTGPQPGAASNSRGKFVDISRQTDDGRMKEQMLVSYYPSKGTFIADAEKFPQLVKETNDTLKKILPGYQMVSQGEIKFNGEWRAYEVKFQGSGMSADGQKLVVWGRRLFVPAARPGTRNGFEITMLATSLADEVKGVDDVGVKGELAPILFSFEPSQNF